MSSEGGHDGRWVELSLDVDVEAVEPVCSLLAPYVEGRLAVQMTPGDDPLGDVEAGAPSTRALIQGYLPARKGWENVKGHIEAVVALIGLACSTGPVNWRVVPETDWANAWKQHYQPLRLGKNILVCPAWHEMEFSEDDLVILLDPGMAFGTGTHPTTQMCLALVEDSVVTGDRVLDLGTGSGILAIAAAKKGASRVLAIDNDPVAVTAAQENVALNSGQYVVDVRNGSIDEAGATSFDVVVANIVASVIVRLADQIAAVVRPGGIVIVSGIIEPRIAEVVERLAAVGLGECQVHRHGEWAAVVGRRDHT